jgi:hypothetical protein
MKSVIYFLIILLSLGSCENEDRIKKNLEEYSLSFFEERKIDYDKYRKYYYKTNNQNYIQYTLMYCKKINKNDSIIIYFTRDSEANYFIEGNDNFYKYHKKPEH